METDEKVTGSNSGTDESITGGSEGSSSGNPTTEEASRPIQDTTDAKPIRESATGSGSAGDSAPYTPNFKFKVKDKELEFDEFVKPIIKNKDLEAKFREIYERSHGLDEVKTSRESFKQQVEEWKGKYGQVEQSLQTLGGFVKKNDFKSFFQALNIPKDKIIQYAIEELKYQELPPEQRQAIDMQREKELEFEQSSLQNQALQNQMAQLVQQQTAFELNQELAKPEIAQTISAYDSRVGNPGAFRAEIIRRGQYYEAVHKISPPASQLIAEVLNLIGGNTVQGVAPQSGTSGQMAQSQKPTITNFQGGGTKSPARRVPTSIEDLRKMRQNL
ncbi:MAG TPA: hypothetical protein VFF49_04755 [Thermodesulfobacteriota bacterium]|nr:hypothetical protein [Thermodesulfobacteriota bacterium]